MKCCRNKPPCSEGKILIQSTLLCSECLAGGCLWPALCHLQQGPEKRREILSAQPENADVSSAPNLSRPFFQTRSAVSKLWILLFWEPHAWRGSLASRAVWNLEACALPRAPQLSPTLTVRMTFLKRHTRRLSNHPFLKCSSLFETSAKPSPHKINCNSFNQIWARHCVVLPQGLCTHSFTPACSFPIQRSGQMSLPQRAFSWPPYHK